MTTLTPEQVRKIDNTGERLGKRFAENDVSTSQLRKVFGEIKRAENEFKFEDDTEQAKQTLFLIKPHLAYAAARKEEMQDVKDEISRFMDLVVGDCSDEDMEIFFRIMEATVAYHSYYTEVGVEN
ncbi:type III-A CRISPR-associated protein Csm2 [Halocatena pleomorpha]|uniref:CRISPR system Cms protein Csm2 n=1 Tax=Halocatena pleomorpha TaxID=1785090 RepID=A0A3P3R9V7_9EURY|nr:type III-A CRISPR-associated protein Csm2 [Halocatena pleomorpha]RRJ30246.1 type III-A CRISPR-associated protein Csm2 [Halocatena pleomorpha]